MRKFLGDYSGEDIFSSSSACAADTGDLFTEFRARVIEEVRVHVILSSLVIIVERSHPFPFRTRSLSSPMPMILGFPGKVGRCQDISPVARHMTVLWGTFVPRFFERSFCLEFVGVLLESAGARFSSFH